LIFKKGKTMKIIAVLAIFLAACSIDFDRNYNQIDNDMIRPISYWFRNRNFWSLEGRTSPETAPGDTVVLDIFFTGKPITLDDIESFSVSWNVLTDAYGNLAPRGEERLQLIGEPHLFNRMNGQILRILFQVPRDILHNADVIPNDLSELSNNYKIGNITEFFPFSTKNDGLAFLENLASDWRLQMAIPFTEGARINGLAQILSAQYQIYVDIKNTPRTIMRNTARWHGRLRNIEGIYLNNNPEFLGWRYYNWSNSWRGDTISLSLSRPEANFVEFGVSRLDFLLTLEQAFARQPITNIEEYWALVFFDGANTRDNLNIQIWDIWYYDYGSYQSVRLTMNVTNNAKVGDTGWIWLLVYDQRLGVANYPQGRDIIGFPIKFVE